MLHNICVYRNKQKSCLACANCIRKCGAKNKNNNKFSNARNYFMGKFVLIAAIFFPFKLANENGRILIWAKSTKGWHGGPRIRCLYNHTITQSTNELWRRWIWNWCFSAMFHFAGGCVLCTIISGWLIVPLCKFMWN